MIPCPKEDEDLASNCGNWDDWKKKSTWADNFQVVSSATIRNIKVSLYLKSKQKLIISVKLK